MSGLEGSRGVRLSAGGPGTNRIVLCPPLVIYTPTIPHLDFFKLLHGSASYGSRGTCCLLQNIQTAYKLGSRTRSYHLPNRRLA